MLGILDVAGETKRHWCRPRYSLLQTVSIVTPTAIQRQRELSSPCTAVKYKAGRLQVYEYRPVEVWYYRLLSPTGVAYLQQHTVQQ